MAMEKRQRNELKKPSKAAYRGLAIRHNTFMELPLYLMDSFCPL